MLIDAIGQSWFIVFAWFILYWIIMRLIYGDIKKAPEKVKNVVGIIVLITGIAIPIVIGLFFSYGSGKYYVNMFPDDGVSKNYRVVADISKVEEGGDYYITKAYFPNGGYITFEDSYGVSELEFNKKVSIKDDKGKEWEIELTKQKAK
jgi:hypothetical protein